MNARHLLSQTGEFRGAEGFLRGNCIIFNPHTPALPCFPQQQRLLSHLKGSTALLHAENTSLARDGAPWAAASALNQAPAPSAVKLAIQQPKVPVAQDEPSGKCSSSSLTHPWHPDWPNPDRLQPLLHPCSSPPEELHELA